MALLRAVSRCVLAVVLLSAAGPALAQKAGWDFERLWLDPSARGSLVLGSGETLPAGGARLSVSGGWERSPLVLTEDGLRGRGIFARNNRIGDVVRDRWTLPRTRPRPGGRPTAGWSSPSCVFGSRDTRPTAS